MANWLLQRMIKLILLLEEIESSLLLLGHVIKIFEKIDLDWSLDYGPVYNMRKITIGCWVIKLSLHDKTYIFCL